MIRTATPQDAAAIVALWNPVITDSVSTFNSVPKTVAEVAQKVRQQPFFLCEQAGEITGFATFFPFRGGVGYAHTAEHTVIVAPTAQGAGTGGALMHHLMAQAKAAGIHSLFAGVSAENPAGVAFHARLGFQTVARLPEVGRKFDRWMDLILMQKFL